MKFTKLANVLVPAVAVLTMAFGSTPARAQQKVKIGVTMALFDDVWLTYVRDAMTAWGKQHPDVDLTIVDANKDRKSVV